MTLTPALRDLYAQRRQHLAQQLGPGGIALILVLCCVGGFFLSRGDDDESSSTSTSAASTSGPSSAGVIAASTKTSIPTTSRFEARTKSARVSISGILMGLYSRTSQFAERFPRFPMMASV